MSTVWEYKIDLIAAATRDDATALAAHLNSLGKRAWELVCLKLDEGSDEEPETYMAILKRQIETGARKTRVAS